MKPLFPPKFTVFLSLTLFIPFGLKTINSNLEPYPAIILPEGSGKLDLKKGVVEVNNLSIYGYTSQGKLQKINVPEFLAPIPRQYFNGIAKNEFGLSSELTKKIGIVGLKEAIEIKRKPISPENQKLAKIWLSNQLRELGLSTSAILIRYEFRQLDIKSEKEISREIKDEKTISLR